MSISLDQQPEVSYCLFLSYLSVEGPQNILKLRYRSLAFALYKAFLKNKKRSATCLALLFSAWFLTIAWLFYLRKMVWSKFYVILDFIKYYFAWVCLCVYFFSPYKTINVMSEIRSAMLCWGNFCVRNLRRHVIDNYSRDLQTSNCAKSVN